MPHGLGLGVTALVNVLHDNSCVGIIVCVKGRSLASSISSEFDHDKITKDLSSDG